MTVLQLVEVAAVAIGALVALGGIAAAGWAYSKVRAMETTLALITAGNQELRDQLVDARQSLADEKVECARSIAHLQGQLDALTGDLAVRLIGEVVTRLKDRP